MHIYIYHFRFYVLDIHVDQIPGISLTLKICKKILHEILFTQLK